MSPEKYFGYWLYPVLDEDRKLEYWDIHEPNDPHGEGEPAEQLFATKEDAKNWVKRRIRDDAFIGGLDRLAQGIRKKQPR